MSFAPAQLNVRWVGVAAGLPFSYDAQQRHVEAPARELEVVGVAAEGRDRVLRRERQPHVVVALVLVEPVLAALIERDRSRTSAARRASSTPSSHSDSSVVSVSLRTRGGLAPLRAPAMAFVTAARDVFGLDQHRRLRALAADFVGPRPRPRSHWPRDRAAAVELSAQARCDAVVVGQDQPVGRDERRRAARLEADDRLLQAVEPLRP